MAKNDSYLGQQLGAFYASMGATTRSAIDMVRRPSPETAEHLHRSLVDTEATVDRLRAALSPEAGR